MHWKERLQAFKKASLAIVIPVMMIGGIISGLFTATEASAGLVVYCLILSLFIYRSLTWKQLPGIFLEAGLASSPVLFTLANAAIFGWLVGYLRGPDLIAGRIESITTNPYAIVALLVLFLLILGTFLSEIATIIIFIPIIQKLGGTRSPPPHSPWSYRGDALVLGACNATVRNLPVDRLRHRQSQGYGRLHGVHYFHRDVPCHRCPGCILPVLDAVAAKTVDAKVCLTSTTCIKGA